MTDEKEIVLAIISEPAFGMNDRGDICLSFHVHDTESGGALQDAACLRGARREIPRRQALLGRAQPRLHGLFQTLDTQMTLSVVDEYQDETLDVYLCSHCKAHFPLWIMVPDEKNPSPGYLKERFTKPSFCPNCGKRA